MPDVIVVGGGICGLQLAALLTRDGQEVLVLEKLSRVGGRAFLWDRDGFTVDNGIHFVRFGPASAMAKVFRQLGRPLDFVGLGKCYVVYPDGREVEFPTRELSVSGPSLLSPAEAAEAQALFTRLLTKDPRDLFETSVAKWLDQEKISGGFRDYFHLVSASVQVCPFLERASAGELVMNLGRMFQKRLAAMYPKSGWRYIFDSLAEEVQNRGQIRTEAPVRRVLIEAGRTLGVELVSGEKIGAERVVVNLPVQQLFTVLEPELCPADFVRRCQGLRPTAGIALDYGLKRKISDHDGLWYLWSPMSFGGFVSNLCPELAPPGRQLLTWFLPTEVSEMADPLLAGKREAELEAAIFRRFPELADAIAWRRASRLAMVDGAEVNIRQHREKRPGYRVPGIENLFLVGDSLKAPGAGGDVGHESVLRCYQEMTGKRVG